MTYNIWTFGQITEYTPCQSIVCAAWMTCSSPQITMNVVQKKTNTERHMRISWKCIFRKIASFFEGYFPPLQVERGYCFQDENSSWSLGLTGIHFTSLGPRDQEPTEHWEKSFCRGSVAGINWPLVQYESPLCQAEEKGLVGSRGRPRHGRPHAETPSLPLTNTAVDNLSFRDSAQHCGVGKEGGCYAALCRRTGSVCVWHAAQEHFHTLVCIVCASAVHS